MTDREAIDVIKSECYVLNPLNFDRSTIINTALDMAIKALEFDLDKHDEEVIKNTVESIWGEPCEDCVSRAEVLKLFGTHDGKYLYEAIRDELPSVQPKPCEEDLPPTVKPVSDKESIKLLVAEWKKLVKSDDADSRLLVAYQIAVSELKKAPCEDVISRDDALDACDQSINIFDATDRIKELPSVKPQPKIGRWITRHHVYGVTYCSECDFELKIDDTNYCPNCGAKMEE